MVLEIRQPSFDLGDPPPWHEPSVCNNGAEDIKHMIFCVIELEQYGI